MKKKCIVIPTYNESANIEKLLANIFSLKISNLDVLVVDDNSPDGTAEIVNQLAHKHPVSLLSRNGKRGLGYAYVDGFKNALSRKYEYIFAMDGDLSHDPLYIASFLKEIENYDLVLGSRYIPGGGIRNWGTIRKFISRCGNIYARKILRINYRDLTGGYKCYRREVLENINLDNINSIGYIFQVETTYKAHQAGYKIKETPIIFCDREKGRSKFSAKIIWESFWKIFLIALKNK